MEWCEGIGVRTIIDEVADIAIAANTQGMGHLLAVFRNRVTYRDNLAPG
jgi:hypothetical protein